jgi:FkbH-like protein
LAASFTAEPILDPLAFWLRELGLDAAVEFAPYNQIFQELLNPGSLLSQNREGVNVLLLRLEDWLKFSRDAEDPERARALLERNARDLIDALRDATARSSTPHLLVFCPSSPATLAEPWRRSLLESLEQQIAAELRDVAGVGVIVAADFAAYPVADAHDARRDALGHIPYTPLFFAALGTLLARRIHGLNSHPYKVIVLDCDNTIWQGVVGEEGPHGVVISPACRRLQEFVVQQAARGFLVCLCSKNEERDVLEVLECRTEMPLKREHLVSWRINWEPKSGNLRALARELNLGLDSFVFIDDNPVECAEVRANCPEVLTLQLPAADEVEPFLRHLWVFDRLKVTSEDRQRTEMYRQNVERARFQQQASNFQEFLAGLQVNVRIEEPSSEQVPRVAQLTQRTNQFNFTTIRRTEGEIQQLAQAGRECRAVEVSDRFGDYGLVGVVIFGQAAESLEVDTFLLSCRVLGRGVEHQMLNALGRIARQRGLSSVTARVIPTKKNLPARQFLEGVAGEFRREVDGAIEYRLPVEAALAAAPGAVEALDDAAEAPAPDRPPPVAGAAPRLLALYERIATGSLGPEQVLLRLRAQEGQRRARPALGHPPSPPGTQAEEQLVALWCDLLRLEAVGIHDNYFDLGGTSLLAVDLFSRIQDRLGVRLPLTALVEAPTIAQLASLMEGGQARDSLVLIRAGGDQPAVFLVHDGDGETMLYRNLALRLDPDHPVYGLQPYSQPGCPMLHTRIEEMAAYHIEKMRSVQPHGPYLIGGMCAGGVIAFEIARQLQARGEEAAMVALIDAADVGAEPIPWQFAGQRLQSFSSVLNHSPGDRSGALRRAVAIVRKAGGKALNLSRYLARKAAGDLQANLKLRLFRFCLDRGLSPPGLAREISVRRVYLFAEKDYRPSGVFDGELTLFRAMEGEGADEPYIKRYRDPLFGWGRRATRGVRVYDVPGGHSSMLQEPNVEILAGHLQATVNESLESRRVDQHTPAPVAP